MRISVCRDHYGMRYFAVFFFSHLAVTTIATKCAPDDKVDTRYLPMEYEDGVDALPVPSLEYDDQSASKLRDLMTDGVRVYGVDLMDNIYHQAIRAGDKLINDVRAANKKLQQSIKSITPHNKKPACLDDDLKELTNKLEKVLKLNPGVAESKRPVLRSIFKQPIEIHPKTTERTAEELFNDGIASIDDIAANLCAYAIHTLRAGWSHARTKFHVFTTQFRNQILNEKVLDACRKVVHEVYEEKDLVRNNVLPETWKSYWSASDRIVKAYDNYKALEENKSC